MKQFTPVSVPNYRPMGPDVVAQMSVGLDGFLSEDDLREIADALWLMSSSAIN